MSKEKANSSAANVQNTLPLSEQEVMRREALAQIKALGIDPYPAAEYKVTHYAKEIKEQVEADETYDFGTVSLAGRLMRKRIMGKASFAELQDSSGKIQLYVSRDDIAPSEDKTLYNTLFKKLLDIGDFIGIKGRVFKTKTGETSIHLSDLVLLSKSLKPLPVTKEKDGERYDVVSNPEFRYRQRYVDLTINPEVRQVFKQRANIINTMRNFMASHGYTEVETPMLQSVYGGAAARPFKTHHNTLDATFYLRIATELYLKRLIVGGFEGVFEFGKNFRNEGMSRFHNPEFTVVELYVAYKDCEWMMQFTEEMLAKVVQNLHNSTQVQLGDKVIDFKRPWQRYTMYEAIEKYTDVDIANMDEYELRRTCRRLGVPEDETMGRGKLIDELFGEKVEPNLIQPTFITDYPVEMSPLAKNHRTHEGLVERFELIANGKEIANAFSELNDPIDQRERFEHQLELANRGDDEAMQVDNDFLRALEYGMPPAAGIGIGIDRLTMILTNQHSIQDVLLFPQMKPEQLQSNTSPEQEPEA